MKLAANCNYSPGTLDRFYYMIKALQTKFSVLRKRYIYSDVIGSKWQMPANKAELGTCANCAMLKRESS